MAEALMSRAGAILAVCAAVALIVLAAWFNHDRARRATARAAAAERQAEMNAEATRQLDRYATTTTIIREKAQEAENAVRSAPGADAPLDRHDLAHVSTRCRPAACGERTSNRP
jgi:Tfp pilus assembly protein PilE